MFQKIAVICAMPVEADAVCEKLEDVRALHAGAFSFRAGRLSGKDVIVGLSGIGKVAAAVCAQAMIDAFRPDAVLNSGVAMN